MDGLSSRGAEGSRGAFTRGPDLFGVQSVFSQEFLRSHQKEPPGSCPQGPQVPQPSPCMPELFPPDQVAAALPQGSEVLPGAWHGSPTLNVYAQEESWQKIPAQAVRTAIWGQVSGPLERRGPREKQGSSIPGFPSCREAVAEGEFRTDSVPPEVGEPDLR